MRRGHNPSTLLPLFRSALVNARKFMTTSESERKAAKEKKRRRPHAGCISIGSITLRVHLAAKSNKFSKRRYCGRQEKRHSIHWRVGSHWMP
ncbi:hypothetical protein ACHAWF_013799 [Thalassiosira exigua]